MDSFACAASYANTRAINILLAEKADINIRALQLIGFATPLDIAEARSWDHSWKIRIIHPSKLNYDQIYFDGGDSAQRQGYENRTRMVVEFLIGREAKRLGELNSPLEAPTESADMIKEEELASMLKMLKGLEEFCIEKFDLDNLLG